MQAVCTTCGTRHNDPGVAAEGELVMLYLGRGAGVRSLPGWRCARCGCATLVRMRRPRVRRDRDRALAALAVVAAVVAMAILSAWWHRP